MNTLEVAGSPADVATFAAHSAGLPPATLSRLAADPGHLAVLTAAVVDGTVGTFQLAGIAPPPAELVDRPTVVSDETRQRLLAAFGYSSVSTWSRAMWGTAGDAHEPRVLWSRPGSLGLRFHTRLSTPAAWASHASVTHPRVSLVLRSVELAGGFDAWWEFRQGAIVAAGQPADSHRSAATAVPGVA